VSTPPATPVAPGDSLPGSPTLPGLGLWSDSDSARPAGPGFTGLVATPADKAIPTIGHIGRYALKYQLGAGGLGTVFAAHDPLLSRLIAVKTLNVEIKDDEREAFNALFINEARAAGGLSHPHIVTVFDAGISDKRAYIAMELLKGRDLRQLRQEGWRATPAQAALIVRRVADALAFAHSKGVIHRDIKPANIFMVGRTQPRVLDFGIARVAHRRESTDALPGAGSPYYMAPEQVRREPGDRRADVFSLGVVLYELLTDTKPFQGESLREITDAVLHHEPPLASKVDPNVPKALAEIAARAMAKDPEQRFRSARSFARDLRQWLDANPVVAEGETTSPTPVAVAPVVRLVPKLAALAVAAAALVGAGVWWQQANDAAGLAAAVAKASVVTPATVASGIAAAASLSPVAVPATDTRSDTAGPAQAPTAAASPSSAPVVAGPAAPVVPATSNHAAGSSDAASPTKPDASLAGLSADSLLLATIVPMHLRSAPAAANPGQATAPVSVGSAALPARRPETSAAAAPASTGNPRESARDKRAREAREREAKERESRVAVAPPLPTGTVRLAVSPWGQVEVDGASSGAAPPLTSLTLAEGKHQIVVRNGDYPPFVASVEVTAGQVITLRHRFGS
jgi:serine/threonine-protein kinase